MLTSCLLAAALAADRPNVLFIAVDDLRCSIGAFGDRTARTPAMDALCATGVVFRRHYVQQAVCSASRASLLTGYRPDTTTVDYPYNDWFSETFLPGHLSFVRRLADAGWQTRHGGKIHHGGVYDLARLGSLRAGTDPWWQHYALPENRALAEAWRKDPKRLPPPTECADVTDEAYHDGALAVSAASAIGDLVRGGKPWCLAVGFVRPHLPFVAPKRYWDLYDPMQLPLASQQAPEGAPPIARASFELPSYAGRLTSDGLAVATDDQRRLTHGYYAATSYVDAQIGRVLAALDASGARQQTVIVLWGDHGFHLGENASWGKHTNYEMATRSPLVIAAPGIAPAVSDALVESVDVLPTLGELAGIAVPSDIEGTSLVPLLRDPARPWKTAAFSQFPRGKKNGEGFAIRTATHRYVEWRQDDRVTARELYDEITDPTETRNLAATQPDLVAALASRLQAGWQAARPPSGPAGR